MATRIKLRRDITANWMDVNPILANGEMGIEADTRRVKIGDGSTAWNDLKYAITDQLRVDGKTINTEMGVSIASQDPETWISSVKAKGNWAGTSGVAYDSMGNLYLSGWEEYGYNQLDGGSGKAFLIKYDSQGQVLWSKYTQLAGYSGGAGVSVDGEDNVIVSTVDWDNDFFAITKYTEDGAVIWQKFYTDNYIYADGFDVAIDSNNDIVVAGRRPDPDHDSNTGIFATKIMGTTGAVVWTATVGRWYTGTWHPTLAVDGDNNVIIASMDTQNNDGMANIVKLTTDGNLLWSKSLRNPEGSFDGYALYLGGLDADQDGNIYFVGSYTVPDYITDIQGNTDDGRAGLVLKMNSDGVVQWSRIVGPGDCEDLGAYIVYNAGKLYATFQTERPYYKNDFANNYFNGYTTQEIVLACYDAENGKVLWQNTFGPEVLWGYANPTGSPDNYQDTDTSSGRLIAVHGDYVAVAGQAGEYSRADDTETRSYGFVAQLPADGTEMDLSGWEYMESKHRGLYAKVQTEDYSDYTVNPTTDIVVNSSGYEPSDTADNVRIELLAAGANQWDFKPNGDLALPVGGNIEISRAAQGDINAVGYFDSNNQNNIGNYFNSVTTDADGNKYYVGLWNWHNNWTPNGTASLPMVVKVNAQGQVEWKVRISNYDLWYGGPVDGEARTVAYDPASGNIVVVCTDSGEGNDEQMLVIDLNAANGDVIDSKRYSAANDIRANGMVINTEGERFITGSVQGDNNISFTVTKAMVASTTTVDTLMVPKSVFDGHLAPDWVTGTNGWQLDAGNNLNNIDLYNGITGTVREGTGATFNITCNGGGDYILDSINTAGANYRVGHKIVIPGNLLGGATPSNDCTVVVSAIDNTTNGGITGVNLYGGSVGGSSYTAVAGTNYNVGSGFTIDVQVNSETGEMIVYHDVGGTNYVAGDKITFSGTQLGGASPAQDIVIEALVVGEVAGDVQSGEGYGYAVTDRGTSPLTYVRLQFSGADFVAGAESYQLLHYTDANSFLAKFTPTGSLSWVKWIEKSNWDEGVAVDYDSDGNIYWASRVYDQAEPNSGNWAYRPTVTKVDSTGTALWSKTYSIDGHEGDVTGLQVDSEDYVVLAYNKWNQNSWNWDPVVKRLTGDGDTLWTKKYWLDGGEGNGGGLALDNDDNIYVTSDNYDGEDYVSWTAKLDIQNGDEIWQQETANENRDIYHGWNDSSNAIATDGKKYYVAKYTFGLDGNEGNAIAIALPADGSAEDTQQGPFAVNAAYYNTEGSTGDWGNSPVVRDYVVSDATSNFTLITNRAPIQSWIEPGPTTNYPVYTKSDAGIVFGDGSVQTTSGQGIPQVRHNRRYKTNKLKLSDAGKHLYMTRRDQTVVIPTYSAVPFPVGTVITIVNISGGYVYVGPEADGYRTTIYCPALDGSEGSPNYVAGWKFEDNGGGNLITLLKVEETWNNGSRWVITGNNVTRWS